MSMVPTVEQELHIFKATINELQGIIRDLNDELVERDEIIKDFMTTTEDLRTWRDEMYATVCEVIGEDI